MKTRKENRTKISQLGASAGFTAAVCMTVAVAGCSMMKSAANEGISDAEITSTVEKNLAAESRLASQTIAVRTDDGVVHLSGNVETGTQRDAAEKLALNSRGVVRVDNYIQFGLREPLVVQ